jgi:hypothetical protein
VKSGKHQQVPSNLHLPWLEQSLGQLSPFLQILLGSGQTSLSDNDPIVFLTPPSPLLQVMTLLVGKVISTLKFPPPASEHFISEQVALFVPPPSSISTHLVPNLFWYLQSNVSLKT